MLATTSGNPSMEASADKSHHTHHQLLNISEILISIFANCSQSTNAALTRVCRAWSDLALDRLWSSLPSLLPLLRVLLPLVIVDDVLDLDRQAGTPNWERFWALAGRVQRLKHNDGLKGDVTEPSTRLSGRISPNVIPFLLLRQSWTSRRFLLPKLETLEWSVYWEDSFSQLCHFVSPVLRSLILYIDNSVPADRAARNLEYLTSLPPMNIERLFIGTGYGMPSSDVQVASVVASFVKSQPTLSVLVAPHLWSRGEIVRGLIQHEDLRYLDLRLGLDTPRELRSLLDLLARQCPRISTFVFSLPLAFPKLTPRHVIEPLLSCSLLQQLQVFHAKGIPVDSDDIKIMAKAWRNMEVLNLCGCANDATQVGTPLTLLLDFAEEFSPQLRRLALNFSCDGMLPAADVVWTSFPRLEVLGVGTSTVGSTVQAITIGEFLASVCSERTRLAYVPDISWGPNAFDTIKWKSSPKAGHWLEVAAYWRVGSDFRKSHWRKVLEPRDSRSPRSS